MTIPSYNMQVFNSYDYNNNTKQGEATYSGRRRSITLPLVINAFERRNKKLNVEITKITPVYKMLHTDLI